LTSELNMSLGTKS